MHFKILVFLPLTKNFYELPEITLIHINYRKYNILRHFLRNDNKSLLLKKNIFFLQYTMINTFGNVLKIRTRHYY